MKPKIIPGLTGLRGVAAVWVVLYHFLAGSGIPVLNAGYLGVDIFFILSGFVLSHVYAANFQHGNLAHYIGAVMIVLEAHV